MPEAATVTLEIPQTGLDAAPMSASELRRELALTLYAQNRLALGQVRELAGLSLWAFRQWLATRHMAAHYDADLAALYGVETQRFNEQVKRNRARFPEDFMFQLTDEEFAALRSQNATSSTRILLPLSET